MIKVFIGRPGSGKTLSMVQKIMESNDEWYHNINGLHCDNATRLKWANILTLHDKEYKPNWTFWEKVKNEGPVNICIDEISNIYDSRRSMTKRSIALNSWVSQIRKLTSSTGNHHLYLVLQRLKSLDVFARDLADEVISCQCFKIAPLRMTEYRFNGRLHKKIMHTHFIKQRHFVSDEAQSAEAKAQYYLDTGERTWSYTSIIRDANPLMKYYDSYDIVNFEESSEYV